MDPFLCRVAAGTLVLSILAWSEWRSRRTLTRAREYAFLLAVALMAVAYAIAHDAVTFSLAPEYFYVLKDVPEHGFFPGVVWLAARAGWTAGLCIGLGLLVSNNPSKNPQLRYRCLSSYVRYPLLWSLALASASGLLGHKIGAGSLGGLGLKDPLSVATVWGIHIGSYGGALLGLVHACVQIHVIRSCAETDSLLGALVTSPGGSTEEAPKKRQLHGG